MTLTRFFRTPKVWRSSLFLTLITAIGFFFSSDHESLYAQDVQADEENATTERLGYLVQIPLPLTHSNAAEVKQTLKRLLDKSPAVVNPKDRAVAILQFDTLRGSTGAGSEFYACSDLAEFLTSAEMNRMKTVAYIPAPRSAGIDNSGRLVGHAVLIALSCQEIVIHESASMGQAGLDVDDVTPPMRATYEFIAGKRRPLPQPITMSLLDPANSLYQVKTDDGTVYVDFDEKERLQKSGKVGAVDTIASPGKLPLFSADQLDSFSINCHKVSSRLQVADRYGLPATTLEGDPTRGTRWQAVQFEMPLFVDQRTVDWSLRAIEAQLGSSTNMIILRLNCEGGELDSCLQISRYLSGLNSEEIRTVAYVESEVQGPAALIALACDHLVMSTDSRIGGVYEPLISEEDLSAIQPSIEELAAEKEKPWSLFYAVLDRNADLGRWQNTKSGRTRLFLKSEKEKLPDADAWNFLGPQPMTEGMNGDNAERLAVARTLVDSFDQLQSFYQIDETPTTLTPTKTDRAIESFARFLATPWVSGWLLFGAMFLISTEMSNPGMSVPGFLGALCLILFFWSQHLDGNAHWLEILLFITGVIFIILEIFVIPGIGVFGIGGLLMVVISIVLASQTFVIPRNSEEFARLPVSLGMVAAASSGFLVALAVLRKVLPNTPYFKKMMLEPPERNELDPIDRESVVDWSELNGKSGTSITPLIPAGKARISGQLVDVITDGRVIEKGEPIVVIDAIGNRVVVGPATSENQS